jgi:esterase/lipase
LRQTDPALLHQQLEVFDLSSPDQVSERETFLVPVNVTYYPIRSQQNAIEKIASYVVRDLPERIVEELQTEGTMLLSGVDIDITFGTPLAISPLLKKRKIQQDILSQHPILPDDVLPSRPLMRRIASNLTRKVMASIYSNTMVNYDHLAAYILKYYPHKRLGFFNLAERLYLAAETVTKLKSIRFHSGLLHDQCVRLCRRYHQILADFLEVAEKSGVVDIEGDTIYKKRLRMKTLFDFHTIRRENPFQVILNEVEFLRPLTKKLRIIAEYPRWFMRWRLHRKFLRLAKQEFAADYKEHRHEGESKPRRIGAPTLYRRFRAKTGVLLVHGYMAAPEEVRPLAEYLHQHGYTVFTPRLRGHGTSPEDLALRTWGDWLQSVERGYLVLANSCEDVVLGGFSVGAALALFAATNTLYKVRAVFAINCALRLRRRSARLAPAVVLWNKLADKLVKDDGRRHFVPNEPENPHINYLRNPISGVKELMELMDELSKRIDLVNVPALLIQSSDDPVVHPEGSKRIYEGLGSQDKELIMFNSDRHGILRGEHSDRVHARVLEFLNSKV